MKLPPIFFDTETCGLHGFAILIQYSIGWGDVVLYNVWKNPVKKTLALIESFANHPGGIVGFNIAFDWFHLCKIYTVFSLIPDKDAIPEDIIEEIAELEMTGRDGPCVKPVTACDLMLHARKGPYQSTMDRHDIRIKRVPVGIAWQLAKELEARIPLKDLYFARRKDNTAEKWQVFDITDDEGKINNDFKDVVLKFAPSSALKALASDALNLPPDSTLLFADVEVDRKFRPEELGYAPFARAIGSPVNWRGAWPEVIQRHIDHWQYNTLAREYARKDVVLTRGLYKHFNSPELGDDDSILACMVAAVRWRGFKVDIEKLKQLRISALAQSKKAPTAPSYAKRYIWPHLTDEERAVLGDSTKKTVLESIVEESKVDCECLGEDDCKKCNGTGEVPSIAAIKAKEVLDARTSEKEVELYEKLILAGRFHASFKVIGTLSTRMSGADGLNAQAIKAEKEVRSCFPLAWDDFQLIGGDFESFEVAIAESEYNDPKLREALTKEVDCPVCETKGKVGEKKCGECGGKGKMKRKIHGLMAAAMFEEETYESILATKGTENDLYKKGKGGVFLKMYGGNAYSFQTRLGLSEAQALKADKRWEDEYPGVKKAQQQVTDMFCSMRQPGGIGTRVIWKDPADYIETRLGDRRYFTLENMICKALYDLAEKPPKGWDDIKAKVMRRDREQTSAGAARSACFAAAFAIQAANVRAATNHVIQCIGARTTKKLQRRLWDVQPTGIHTFLILPLNVHDEIMAPTKPSHVGIVSEIVHNTVEEFRPMIPLIAIDWSNDLKTWADK